jgi:hypothetical protein
VFSPAFATAHQDAAHAIRNAAVALWTSVRTTNRDITTSIGISAAIHLALLLVFGAALYTSGNDDADIPELSVQLVTRAGPSSQEYTEAALPQPAPEPVQDVVDDPGTSNQTLDAPVVASTEPAQQHVPDVSELAPDAALAQQPPSAEPLPETPVLTTTGESDNTVATQVEPLTPPVEPVPHDEQQMLTKNVQQLAQKLLDSNMTRTELTWEQDGQQYSARVMRQPAADSTGLEQVIAEIMTDKDGKRMKTHLSMKRLAFSHFTQLVNHWDPNIMLHDDVIDGRFHSNTEIGLAFSGGIEPRFFGKVTTAAPTMTRENSLNRKKNQEVFQGGVETRTERVTLPRDMPDVVNGGDAADRKVFAEDTRIIFNPDGSYVWRLANGDGPLQRADSSERPRYLIGDKGAKLYVRGTVAGMFTVYSPTDIEIEGDIVYSKDPRDSLMSRDFLALISGRDIRVATTQITGVGDLHIHAALFAHRRFSIESVDRGKVGKLLILGSLTAGTIMETEPRYATKLDYDKRFEYLRPANFPMTRRYEVDSWDQDWEEVEGPDAPSPGLARSE